MNPADEEAVKRESTERPSSGAAASSLNKSDEQVRVSVEALLHPSPPPIPVEDLDGLLSGWLITSTTRLRSERQFIIVC
jgi:hypothetical protein